MNLWEEQLPPGSLVVLSGRDVLMAAAEVSTRGDRLACCLLGIAVDHYRQ